MLNTINYISLYFSNLWCTQTCPWRYASFYCSLRIKQASNDYSTFFKRQVVPLRVLVLAICVLRRLHIYERDYMRFYVQRYVCLCVDPCGHVISIFMCVPMYTRKLCTKYVCACSRSCVVRPMWLPRGWVGRVVVVVDDGDDVYGKGVCSSDVSSRGVFYQRALHTRPTKGIASVCTNEGKTTWERELRGLDRNIYICMQTCKFCMHAWKNAANHVLRFHWRSISPVSCK